MKGKVRNECDPAATVARLAADVDALDRGLIDVGVTASRALSKAENVEAGLRSARRAAGYDDAAASHSDPPLARQARKRHVGRSGLRVLPGGSS